MFDFDKWQEILTTLQRHKLRTLLTAFGVFWGIFMLVLLLGVGRGLEKGVYANFARLATNSFFVWGDETSLPYKGFSPGRWIELNNMDIEAIREQTPEIESLNAGNYLWGRTVSYKENSGSFSVLGNLPDLLAIKPHEILQGRFINIPDVESKRKVAAIGRRVKEVLFGAEEALGAYITIDGVSFQVVGVFNLAKVADQGRDPTDRIYIPLTTFQQVFNYGDRVGWLGMCVKADMSVAKVEERVKALLKRRHHVAPGDERGIGSWNAEALFKKVQGLFYILALFIWLVGTGTIVAGIVGVSNIMLITVKERTSEIGVRKALGATPFSIVSLILQEAVFITAVSGYMGLVAGVAAIEAISYLMDRFALQNEIFTNPEIDFQMAITATVLLVFTGTLAGLIPARIAVKINPIEALRSE